MWHTLRADCYFLCSPIPWTSLCWAGIAAWAVVYLAHSTERSAAVLTEGLASSAKEFAYNGLTEGASTLGTTLGGTMGTSIEKAATSLGLLTAGGLTAAPIIGAAVRAALRK